MLELTLSRPALRECAACLLSCFCLARIAGVLTVGVAGLRTREDREAAPSPSGDANPAADLGEPSLAVAVPATSVWAGAPPKTFPGSGEPRL